MEKKKEAVRIELTEDQKQVIRNATGKEIESLEFSAEALEERIAPRRAVDLG